MNESDAINVLTCVAALGATIAEQRDLYRDLVDENADLRRKNAEQQELLGRKQAELLKMMRDRDAIAAANEMLNRELRRRDAEQNDAQERPTA